MQDHESRRKSSPRRCDSAGSGLPRTRGQGALCQEGHRSPPRRQFQESNGGETGLRRRWGQVEAEVAELTVVSGSWVVKSGEQKLMEGTGEVEGLWFHSCDE